MTLSSQHISRRRAHAIQRVHNRFVFSADKIVRLDSEYERSDGKSVNRGRPVWDLLDGGNSLMLTKRSAAFADENDKLVA